MASLDFPFSVDDEPANTWTIEQVMHWWLLHSHAESDAAYEVIVKDLSSQLEEGKEALMNDHKVVSEFLSGKGPSENEDPQEPAVSGVVKEKTVKTAKPMVKDNQGASIFVEIQAGDYQGNTYTLEPKVRSHAWVGRSQGKKFREKGISLPKDLEVSTTHGRFELLRNKFVFVDTGSTNGSRVGEADIVPNEPVELESGMIITVGQTVMKITLL
eukprot:scaffold1319_cov126-Cylindrotheca_fusiformis.AAC.46